MTSISPYFQIVRHQSGKSLSSFIIDLPLSDINHLAANDETHSGMRIADRMVRWW